MANEDNSDAGKALADAKKKERAEKAKAKDEPKMIDNGIEELKLITGQSPVVSRAKKDIAVFKLRKGQKIGVMVTLRRERMWEFLDRLCNIALPRVRDFRGVSPRGFD